MNPKRSILDIQALKEVMLVSFLALVAMKICKGAGGGLTMFLCRI